MPRKVDRGKVVPFASPQSKPKQRRKSSGLPPSTRLTVGAELRVNIRAPTCPYLHLPALDRVLMLGMDAMISRIICGESLRSIARYLNVAPSTVLKYVNDPDFPERKRLYDAAYVAQASTFVEMALDIAAEPVPYAQFGMDSAAVQDKRLRIDTLKWIASKQHPARFGERLAVESAPPRELTPEQRVARISMLFAKALEAMPELSGKLLPAMVAETEDGAP